MPILKVIAKILAKGLKLFGIAVAIVFATLIVPIFLANAIHPILGSLGPVGMVVAMRWLATHGSSQEESTLNEHAANNDMLILTVPSNNGFLQ